MYEEVNTLRLIDWLRALGRKPLMTARVVLYPTSATAGASPMNVLMTY